MSSLPRTAESPAATERRTRLGPVSEFIERHYRHFNAAALNDAALAYIAHLDSGGSMMMALAGAMSTAELGVSLAESGACENRARGRGRRAIRIRSRPCAERSP